jgi:acetyltransferase-like isoleucine patch superfamily enzyme
MTRGRGALKVVLNGVASLVVLPFIGAYRLSAALWPTRRDSLFQGYSELFSLWPGMSGHFVRRAFYRATLRRCSEECAIGFGTLFATADVDIGEHVYIGAHCMIGHVTIGDHVLIGSRVDIPSGKHQHHFDRLDVPIRLQGGAFTRVTIGADTWIGNGATILDDVGSQAIVAAGAVVVRPVSPRAIVGGNPAVVLGHRGSRGHDRGHELSTRRGHVPPEVEVS